MWIKVADALPKEDGAYLVTRDAFGHRYVDVVRFSTYLSEIDDYAFNGVNRPGWYYPDLEYGPYEIDSVTHWMPLPELPKEE